MNAIYKSWTGIVGDGSHTSPELVPYPHPFPCPCLVLSCGCLGLVSSCLQNVKERLTPGVMHECMIVLSLCIVLSCLLYRLVWWLSSDWLVS